MAARSTERLRIVVVRARASLTCCVFLATIEHVRVWLVLTLWRLLRLAQLINILAELIDIRHLLHILVVLIGFTIVVCRPTIFLFDVVLGIQIALAAIGLSRLGGALIVAVEVFPAVFMDDLIYLIIVSRRKVYIASEGRRIL